MHRVQPGSGSRAPEGGGSRQGRPVPAGRGQAPARRPGAAPGGRIQQPRPAGRPRPTGQRPDPRRQNGAPQRRPSDNRRPPQRKSRTGIAILAAVLVVLAVGITAVVLHQRQQQPEPVECFADNVYINGVCLSGLTREQGIGVIYEKRDNWLNTEYQLSYNDRTWSFTPASVNASLEFDEQLEKAWNLGHVGDKATRREVLKGLQQVPAQFSSEPVYDEAGLETFISGIAAEIDRDPVNAEVTLTEEKPVITQASVNGLKLNQEKLKETLVSFIMTGEGETQLPVEEIQPDIVSEDMEMRIIAKFETDVSFRGYPSRNNVRLALNHFNLFAVYPGQTVSFNEVVGPRTEALGFKEAPEYAGDNTEMGIGGGVCQASTTLYNALIQAGMSIVERHRHTMTVTYVDPSLDAAVSYGQKDLVFKNNTEHTIYIYTNVSKETASVTIYGARPIYHYELESVVLNEEKSTKTGYQDDVDGTHVWFTTDAPKLYKEGRGSCESEGWIVSYDWDTKLEVSRVQLSHDFYSAGVNVYWRGVHKPAESSD